MAGPLRIPSKSGQRKMRVTRHNITFRANVRLDASMVTDLRTGGRGTSAQLQQRRRLRSSRGTRL